LQLPNEAPALTLGRRLRALSAKRNIESRPEAARGVPIALSLRVCLCPAHRERHVWCIAVVQARTNGWLHPVPSQAGLASLALDGKDPDFSSCVS